MIKNESIESFVDNFHSYLNSQTIQSYLQSLSGQEKRFNVIDIDHNYAKPWNRHPDAQIRAKAAKFLFMKNFPKHFRRYEFFDNSEVDVVSVETPKTLPILSNTTNEAIAPKMLITSNESNELTTPSKTGWTQPMHKLWTQTMKILQSDRLARLSYETLPNEIILKRNLMERTTTKFRHLFAGTGWDLNIISWLNNTLNEYVGPVFLSPYHESMQMLRLKIPTLIDKFYNPPKDSSRFRTQISDPIQTMLNNYKPKRINGSPLFLIVPNGPQIPHQMTSNRMKHWHNLFGSLGKVITVSAISRPYEPVVEFLNEIRYSVRDKIKECKTTFNEGRPLILIGFGHSSLIAAHCALDNAADVTATICLGFPLTAINGFRGDLDDPLLETTVPTLFIIGQNSTMATLDDMEDFRERITKTETGLVVIGGANDRLFVSSNKKKFEGITQTLVDRSIADEIHDFVAGVLNPSSIPVQSTSSRVSPTKSGSNKSISFQSGVIAIPKPRCKRPSNRDRDKDRKPGPKGRPGRKKSKPDPSPKPEPKAKSTVERKPSASELKALEPIAQPQPSHPKPIISIPRLPEMPLTPILKETLTPTTSNDPLIQLTPEKTKSEDNTTPDSNSTVSVASNDSTGNPFNIIANQTPKTERHYGLSYGISEMPTVISQSATRTGRQIRAPKSLDV